MAGGKIDILVEPDTTGFDRKLANDLKGAASTAGKVGKGIGLALAAGAAAAGLGLASVIEKGNEYTANLNEMQAVTQATALDMKRVGVVAKELGADMSLPATSAADAAAAMVELAKGGLSVDEAMQAAQGTLQLAAAAQVDGAQAAELQAAALNAFKLEADQAGRVADVLANTANAAAGSMVDVGNSLKFVAPVAAALNITIEDTAAAIGLLANQGVKGEQAGTSLRGILASLASPSKAAKKALAELGVQAFDNQGKFVGLRTFTDQLAKAKGRLTDASFAAAASTAFGNEGFTAANALAAEGAKAFDQMAVAVGRAGGAEDVAAAKTKGLGGAIEGFKSQVETAGIEIYEAIAPPLEAAVRGAANFVSDLTPVVVGGIEKAVAAGQVFGPDLADAMKSRASVVGEAVHQVLAPIGEAIPGLLNAAINAGIGLWNDFTDVLSDVVDAVAPVARGIADVAKAAVEADGPVSAAGAALGVVGGIAKTVAGVLEPVGKLVGGLISAFAELPGPVQTAVFALGLMAAMRGPLSSLGDTVRTRVTAPFKAMGEEIRLQQALLTGSTDIMSSQVGKVGLAMAALEARVPVFQKMRGSFEEAASGAERFSRTAGLAAAAGTAMRSAAGGLISVLGGPWGLAIAGAAVGLSLLADKQQRAAAQAQQHRAAVDSLADTLRDTNEVAGRLELARTLTSEFSDAAKAAGEFGISLDEIVNSASLGVPVTNQFAGELDALKKVIQDDPLSEQGQKAIKLVGTIGELASRWQDAKTKNEQMAEAIRNGDVSMLDATDTGRDLSKAMEVLKDKTAGADDKARALKDAMDALSGNAITLEAANAKLNESMARLGEIFGENLNKADGWGAALLNADGSINTTLPNGRRLFDSLRDISGQMAVVAQNTFDASVAQDGHATALEKAKAAAQATRDEFVKQNVAMGLTITQAEALADRYGLLPDKVVTVIEAPGMSDTQKELLVLKDQVDAVPAKKTITVESLSDEAKKKLEELGFTVKTLPNGQVQVTANTDAAKTELDRFIQNNQNRVIGVRVETRFSPGVSGGRQFEFAKGGIAKAYAAGGVERVLAPMPAGVAQVVPPNTWRIIGDRIRDDEFYIPDDGSARSLAIGSEWARRQGLALVRAFAMGGVAQVQSGRDTVPDPRRPTVHVDKLEVRALSDRFSMRQLEEELFFAGLH